MISNIYHLIHKYIFTLKTFRIPLHYACESGNYNVTEAIISQIEQMEDHQSLISKDDKGIILFGL